MCNYLQKYRFPRIRSAIRVDALAAKEWVVEKRCAARCPLWPPPTSSLSLFRNWRHRPNRDCAHWLIKDVWPLVRKEMGRHEFWSEVGSKTARQSRLIHTAVSNWFDFSLLSVFSTRVFQMLCLRISIIEEEMDRSREFVQGKTSVARKL